MRVACVHAPQIALQAILRRDPELRQDAVVLGRMFFEIGDLGRLYDNERAVAQGLAAQAARVGLAVRAAVASSKSVARVASLATDIALVPAGGERAFLAPLPVRHALDAPG